MRRIASALLTVLTATALAACVPGLPALPEGVIYPSITLDETVAADHTVSVDFMFEGTPVTFDLVVDGALYAGASGAQKSVTRFGNARENDWIDDYYPAFIHEPRQNGFYDALIERFRAVRDARGLDADRYAELLAVYAQSITYRTDPVDLSPKFPVETFVDGAGDCDDKTLLLSALLLREGYDVAIMLFEAESHVSLGLRSDDIGYLGTGYAFVETTAPGFVGMVPDELAGGITLSSQPRVFHLGGTTPYGSGSQVRRILDGREEAIARAGALEAEIAQADAELASLEAEVRQTRSTLDQLRSSGRISEYNALVDPYNALIADYNAVTERRNGLADRFNALAVLDRAIVDGLNDRPGTYAKVVATLG